MRKGSKIKNTVNFIERYRGLGKFLIGFIFLYITIELLAHFFDLPHFQQIFMSIKGLWNEGILIHDIAVSSFRWIIGWSVGSLLGICVGIITGRSRIASNLFEGYIVILRAIPFIALVPLVIYIFGLSELGKFFIVGWASFSVTWAIIHEGSLKIPQVMIWRSRSLGVGKFRFISKILVPHLNIQIFSALRTSLSLGLIVVAVAELSGVYEYSTGIWWSEGIGYRIFRASDQARDDIMMAAILVFSFLGILYDFAFKSFWSIISRFNNFYKDRKIQNEIDDLYENVNEKGNLTLFPKTEVAIENLKAAYADKVVINHFDSNIEAGSVLSIVGYSGCGKSTLLRAIGGFLGNELKIEGRVYLDSKERIGITTDIGIVFQDSSVFENLSVWENAIMGNRVKTIEDKLRVYQLLKEFGLDKNIKDRASNLSGGQKQRLALASAIANKPLLLMLDEPFGALDAITRRNLQDFYNSKIRGILTTIFVTHDIHEAIVVGDKLRVGLSKNSTEFDLSDIHEKKDSVNSQKIIQFEEIVLSALERSVEEISKE